MGRSTSAGTRPIGVAIVGTGFGCLTHLRAFRAAGFDVQALVGRDADKTVQRADRFGVPHAVTSIDDALKLPGIEAVTIATPPHTHAPIALAAIASGKHVLCEKPFTTDANEAAQLLADAESAGVVHLLGTEFRWATGRATAARAIAGGAIGTPRLATFLLHIPMLADPAGALPDWWQDSAQGGGWLGAQAAHTIDQVRVTLGEFAGLSASLSLVAPRPMSAEDSYTVHFRLCSGLDGIMQSTASAWGPPLLTTRIVGEGGTLWLEGDRVWVADGDGTRQLAVPDDLRLPPPDPPPADLLVTAYDQMHAFGIDLAPYTRLAEAFRDLILGRVVPDDPPVATFADGHAAMVVLDAIRRAAAEGTWVEIDRDLRSAGGAS